MNRRELLLTTFGAAWTQYMPSLLAQSGNKDRQLNSIIQPEPATLILALNLQASTQTVAGKIYQGLLVYDFDLKPRAELAKSWTVSSDGLTYTFKLQEGVKWHDGHPFTSSDVVFSTKTMLPATHPIARGNFANVDDVVAPDPHTVVFKLKKPYAPLMMALAVGSAPMMPKHLYEGSDFRKNPSNATPIGTGPFKFKAWEKGQHIHLTRNESYWREGRPKINDLYYRVVPDSAARVIALDTGSVDLAAFGDIEPFDVPRLAKNSNLAVTSKGYEYYSPISWIEINHRVKPLDDKRFRQAMMFAINREFIRDKIFFGQAKVATGPISSTMRFYDKNVPMYSYDPQRAERLLDEMGLKRKADGTRVSVKLLALPYGERWTRTAEFIRQALAKVGIQTTLETVDAGTWAQRVSNWDYELTLDFVYQLGDPAIGIARTYVSSSIRKGVLFTNTMGYSNLVVDDLFSQAATAISDAERQALYSKTQQLLVDEVPVCWLVELQFPTIHNKQLRNLITSAIGVNDTFDAAYWA